MWHLRHGRTRPGPCSGPPDTAVGVDSVEQRKPKLTAGWIESATEVSCSWSVSCRRLKRFDTVVKYLHLQQSLSAKSFVRTPLTFARVCPLLTPKMATAPSEGMVHEVGTNPSKVIPSLYRTIIMIPYRYVPYASQTASSRPMTSVCKNK